MHKGVLLQHHYSTILWIYMQLVAWRGQAFSSEYAASFMGCSGFRRSHPRVDAGKGQQDKSVVHEPECDGGNQVYRAKMRGKTYGEKQNTDPKQNFTWRFGLHEMTPSRRNGLLAICWYKFTKEWGEGQEASFVEAAAAFPRIVEMFRAPK